jgi:hypothetical protein
MSIAAPSPSSGTSNPLVVLIAPNVSEQMGGEAMKALQILRELRRMLPDALQITHDRNAAETPGWDSRACISCRTAGCRC